MLPADTAAPMAVIFNQVVVGSSSSDRMPTGIDQSTLSVKDEVSLTLTLAIACRDCFRRRCGGPPRDRCDDRSPILRAVCPTFGRSSLYRGPRKTEHGGTIH